MSPAVDAGLRAVLDTNIYISAFEFPKGRNALLWRAAREGRFQLLVSPMIARVLRNDFGWQEDGIHVLVRRIVEVAGAGLCAPRTTVYAVAADPDDNHILECAMDGKADLIVSNDRHLLDLKEYAGMPIVGSVDFRRTLGLK
jgi:uncharacterized protein